MKVAAIIPSAGRGTRMNAARSKQFLSLGGKPVLFHTLLAFERCPGIDEIVLVLSREERKIAVEEALGLFNFKKISALVEGGRSRQESVFNGLKAVDPGSDLVVVHDGCRPFVTKEIIEASLSAAREWGAAIAALPLQDTLKKAPSGVIEKTVDRSGVWQAQTPQTFRLKLLVEAYEEALKEKVEATDDAGLVERLGHPVKIIQGSAFNIKITVPADLVLAELFLKHQNDRNR